MHNIYFKNLLKSTCLNFKSVKSINVGVATNMGTKSVKANKMWVEMDNKIMCLPKNTALQIVHTNRPYLSKTGSVSRKTC